MVCKYCIEEKQLPDRNTGEIRNIEIGVVLSGANCNKITEKIIARFDEPHKGVLFKHINYDVYKQGLDDKWIFSNRFPNSENHVPCEDRSQAKEITKKMFGHLTDVHKNIEV